MADTTGTVFYSITFFMIATAIGVNSLGMYLMVDMKSAGSNANIILIHLSCIKIIISLDEAVLGALELLGRGHTFKEYQVVDIINAGLYGVNDLIVVALTIDRLIAISKPLAYNARMTKTKLQAAVVCCWFIGTCGIIPFFFIDYDFLYDIYYKIVFLTLDSFVLVTAFITYGAILKMLFLRHQSFSIKSRGTVWTMHSAQAQKRASANWRQHRRFMYISSLIMASFILFVAIPDSIYVALVIIRGNEDLMIERSIGFVWSLYLVADPIIYIFMQRPIRRRLKALTFKRKNNVHSFSANTIRNGKRNTINFNLRESGTI